MWLLSYLAVAHSDVPAITGLLYGIQPVVIAIVVEAVLRIGGRTINHWAPRRLLHRGFHRPLLLLCTLPAGRASRRLGGLLLSRAVPAAFHGGSHGSSDEEESAVVRVASDGLPSPLRNLRLIGTFLVLWAVPVGVYLWRGGNDVLVDEALFFTGAAFVTFGGAYAVLGYISDVAVGQYGWLTADQMVQGSASPSPRRGR